MNLPQKIRELAKENAMKAHVGTVQDWHECIFTAGAQAGFNLAIEMLRSDEAREYSCDTPAFRSMRIHRKHTEMADWLTSQAKQEGGGG